ncbi:Purple acid phosphatase 10 isoform 2 [Theobroma cacao]|uniref:Purple acid phosphatase n=1 Tax=Theobroma cacao TaxID=3641 RepID=A0A061FC25_THECC|nr:Purple acid phosphatase 10 isoform 2 [Theobroma cacao]
MVARWDCASFALVIAVGLIFSVAEVCNGGKTSSFVRNDQLSHDMPLDSDVFRIPPGYNAPQQVHITQGDHLGKGVIVSWVTPDEPGSNLVLYWAENSELKHQAEGIVLTYKYFNYTSGYIHHCTITNLESDTKYYYEVGIGNTSREFWFRTPPEVGPDVPYTFGLIAIYTPQYKWLQKEFQKVNRTETPWLIVLMHCPFYSSYVHHYMEGESMRVIYEPWFVQHKVDVVFAGHVHAYERSDRISNIAYNVVNGLCTPISDLSAPVYITIGDGGNLEGLVTEMTEPQPSYSAFREASFGHGIFDIKNRTHAHFSWHRNQDGYAVEADSLWFHNRYWSVSEDYI